MFSAKNPGDHIYILYKNVNEKPVLKIGEIVSKTEPVPTYNTFGANYNDTKINITVNVDNTQMELKNVNASAAVMSDPSIGIFVTETCEAMANEISNLRRASSKHIEDTKYHETAIVEYDNMLKQLSPRYAEDKRRDEDIANLTKRQDSMDAKLDQILNAINNK